MWVHLIIKDLFVPCTQCALAYSISFSDWVQVMNFVQKLNWIPVLFSLTKALIRADLCSNYCRDWDTALQHITKKQTESADGHICLNSGHISFLFLTIQCSCLNSSIEVLVVVVAMFLFWKQSTSSFTHNNTVLFLMLGRIPSSLTTVWLERGFGLARRRHPKRSRKQWEMLLGS